MKTTISYINFTYIILSSYTTTIKFYSYFVLDSIQFLIELRSYTHSITDYPCHLTLT